MVPQTSFMYMYSGMGGWDITLPGSTLCADVIILSDLVGCMFVA